MVVAFNQEKALVGPFSVIMKTDCEIDGSSAALVSNHRPGVIIGWEVSIAYLVSRIKGNGKMARPII